jgi:uridine kinase
MPKPELLVAIVNGSSSDQTAQPEAIRKRLGREKVATFYLEYLFKGTLTDKRPSVSSSADPDMFFWDAYRAHIRNLKEGKLTIVKTPPRFDEDGNISSRAIVPEGIVVVSGLLALHDTETNQLFDTSIFVGPPTCPAGESADNYMTHVNPQLKRAGHVVYDKPEEATARIVDIIHENLLSRGSTSLLSVWAG